MAWLPYSARVSGSTGPPGTMTRAPGTAASAAATCRDRHSAVTGRPASSCATAWQVVPLSMMSES